MSHRGWRLCQKLGNVDVHSLRKFNKPIIGELHLIILDLGESRYGQPCHRAYFGERPLVAIANVSQNVAEAGFRIIHS